jgi:hypothetical protein
MAQVAAPSSVNYSNQLPLGIESKSHRRLFFPSTGDEYKPNGTNICRIDLNYDGMLDTSQSYLMFDITNTSGKKLKLDLGHPVISRLTISSGGVVLEDIQHYNQLVGGILMPSQAGVGNLHAQSFNLGTDTSTTTGQMIRSSVNTGYNIRQISSASAENGVAATGVLANGDSHTVCYKLISGLLDNDKYLPLVLMNAGITVQIELAPGNEIGVSEASDAADITYGISAVRYVAHLIDLERGFYDRLRSVQQASGGQLTIAGTSFRSYTGNFGVSGSNTLNIPARVRSIKSVFWKLSVAANKQQYNLSSGCHGNIASYQLKIGATNYPPTAIKVNAVTNKIEPYLELQKAFGKLGSTVHSDMLGVGSYLTKETVPADQMTAAGSAYMFGPFGIDLEAFRHEIENGINTSERSLPMSLSLEGAAGTAAVAHIYVMYDAMFYVDMSGAVSVSS